MIFIDTSAWIEYFRNGRPSIVNKVRHALQEDDVAMGDLVYCEIMQGIYKEDQRKIIDALFYDLPMFEMAGFDLAGKSAFNFRLLRSKGVTVRKTIDVMIGTFCVEHDMPLIHHDRDFDLMARHIGLTIR